MNVLDDGRLAPNGAARAAEAVCEPLVDIDRDVLDDEMANSRDAEASA